MRGASTRGSSFANLAALVDGGASEAPAHLAKPPSSSALSAGSDRPSEKPERLIIVSNVLPLRQQRRPAAPGAPAAWLFEWDDDSLVGQAKVGIEQPQFADIQARSSGPWVAWVRRWRPVLPVRSPLGVPRVRGWARALGARVWAAGAGLAGASAAGRARLPAAVQSPYPGRASGALLRRRSRRAGPPSPPPAPGLAGAGRRQGPARRCAEVVTP